MSKRPSKRSALARPEDVSRLDLRVGRVSFVQEHPLSDELYVIQVFMGEEVQRPSISPVRYFYRRKHLKNKLVVVVCNVRHKVRHLESDCFVLFAHRDQHIFGEVELLEPPETCEAGDPVSVPGYPYQPHIRPFLAITEGKRLFKVVATELRVNHEGCAEYRGVPLRAGDNGLITTPTLRDCIIKK